VPSSNACIARRQSTRSTPTSGIRKERAAERSRGVWAFPCSSRSEVEQFALEHGIARERLCVIHNAIDAQLFRRGERAQARAALELPDDAPLIVSVGHLVSGKRFHELIEAFAKLRASRPSALLVIVGGRAYERAYPDRLQGLVRQRGLEHCVRFAGNLAPAAVAGWLQAADVFALPTEREGCCNAILEALATGLPVVTTLAGDNPKFVSDGQNGFIVPIGDTSALEAAIGTALQSDWDRDAIARRLNEQVGSWERVGMRAVEFIRERVAVEREYGRETGRGH
jgi:glycosyltransferase involved in cell wall biosynthesis